MAEPIIDSSLTGAVSKKGKRGFASMDPQRQREIAAAGGVAAHRCGRAHEFTSEEARIAGSKGGTGRAQRKKGIAPQV